MLWDLSHDEMTLEGEEIISQNAMEPETENITLPKTMCAVLNTAIILTLSRGLGAVSFLVRM